MCRPALSNYSPLAVETAVCSALSSLEEPQHHFGSSSVQLQLFPWDECPCTSRKPKSDKLLKSLGVVCKTSPSGEPECLTIFWRQTLGFAFGKSLGFRLSLGRSFSRQPLRLFNSLSQWLQMLPWVLKLNEFLHYGHPILEHLNGSSRLGTRYYNQYQVIFTLSGVK